MTSATIAARRLDIDLSDHSALGEELIQRLNEIRETEPVFWSEAQNGWFVTRYADVATGLMGAKVPLSNERMDELAFAAIPTEEWAQRIPLLTTAARAMSSMTDPPIHTRLRKPMNNAFAKNNVEAMRLFIQERIRQLLGAPEQRDIEFVESIARPLTGGVIMQLMGVPEAHLNDLREWTVPLVMTLASTRPAAAILEEGEKAMREMDKVFTHEIERRRAAPTDDFLSTLALAGEGEEALTRPEVIGTCINTLLAGHESTASTMALGIAAFVDHPEQIEFMLAHPERNLQTVEEVSRYAAMSTCMTRIASRDFEWHGKQIKKGDSVYLWIAAGNRDPRVFERPDEFDLTRNIKETLVFGRGLHHCVGHFLAKLELSEFFPALFQRFGVQVLDDPLHFSGSFTFRTLEELNIRMTPSGRATA